MARKFFYVAAGMLCLALAYHLGAQSATAQVQSIVGEIDAIPQSGAFAGVLGRVVYRGDGGPGSPMPPVPGTSPIIAVCGPRGAVMLENGDLWVYQNNQWELAANIFGGATPATRETWGQVKSRYAPSRTAKPGATSR